MAPPAELDERLATLWTLWRSKRPASPLPGRGDFDPLEMGRLLPFLFLIDVLDREPLAMRYRLVGTAIVNAVGRDDTGRPVDEADNGRNWTELEPEFRAAAVDGTPSWRWNEGARADGRPFRYQRVLLPLSRDGRIVDMILGGAIHVS